MTSKSQPILEKFQALVLRLECLMSAGAGA